MIVAANPSSRLTEAREEAEYEKWVHWPIHWSAIFVGALASLAAVLIFGLIGLAVGAHEVGPEARMVDLKKLGFVTLIFSVAGAFFSFVLGGWVAGKIAGILRSEPGMLHGVIVWLMAVPIMVVLCGLGAASLFGGWYAGLNGSFSASNSALPFDKPEPLWGNASIVEREQHRVKMEEYQEKLKEWRANTPKVARNTALGAITAVLLGLVGSVIGGWLASGEPMNFTHYRTRPKRMTRTLDNRV